MSANFTGDASKWWTTDFAERFCQEPFDRAFFINCGNGWVEREFVDNGWVRSATAFDYSDDLLRQAEAGRGTRPIEYFQADANRLELEADQFDLIVNVASLHHVQYIDRMCRMLCNSLKPDGLILNYDYIGPGRNQYPQRQWRNIRAVNRSLPPNWRKKPLRRPHLPTMLYTDPTEAIHSDLVVETLGRYFDIFERHDTAGGVAYELLTHNPRLKTLPAETADRLVDRVLKADRDLTRRGEVPTMFSYFLARPRKETLADEQGLARYSSAEEERERRAAQRRGTYSTAQYLEVLAWPLVQRVARLTGAIT
jgi:SAM-dependent methyltransferase